MTTRSQRERSAATAKLPVPDGWHLIPCGASDMLPCGCATARLIGIPCAPVAWIATFGRYRLRCLVCGREWTRGMFSGCKSRGEILLLDASHTDERAARDARLAAGQRERERIARRDLIGARARRRR